jgi:hypothetical protein
MFGFLNRSGTSSATAAVQRALSAADLPPGLDPTGFGVLESRGSYAGRKVTYFRVFDPRRIDGQNGKRLRYQDLEARRELVLQSGYVEEDGTVVFRQVLTAAPAGETSEEGANGSWRAPADRAAHLDDERFVAREAGR